ncbi:MAG: hypothetical protein WCY89_09830 [Flavobacteriaceae bacterium]
MKKVFLLPFLLGAFFVTAQQITVEEIYANYINAIGGKEKITNIVNQKQHIAFYSSIKVSKGESNSFVNAAKKLMDNSQTVENGNIAGLFGITTREQDSLHLVKELIAFTDRANNEYASLSKSSEGNFTRLLNLNGNFYSVNEDGIKNRYSSSFNPFKDDFFPEAAIRAGREVMSNEIYKGEEVYVVKYEAERATPTIKKNDVYEYFSTATGLKVASKQITEIEIKTHKSITTTITEYEDYKEADGILIPHKTIFYNKEGKRQLEHIILNIQFNIDPEDFKQNCFQNPEACFEEYKRN